MRSFYKKFGKSVGLAASLVAVIVGATVKALSFENKDQIEAGLLTEEFELPFPTTVKLWPEKVAESSSADPCNYAGINTGNTGTTKVRIINCVKTVYYSISQWGTVEASLEDFRAKIAETLSDKRGWSQILAFKEVQTGADVQFILSDPASLDATPGCSGDLSCTNWSNQVIINDVRWREGTEASRAAGMSTRDYQHMVINHELGHWLGHYEHETSCPNGGPAPIMLQQSTGLRGCDSFNAWPLKSELWTLR